MKESDITPEVIRLSKEIAEHWRMEIYEGCWLYDTVFKIIIPPYHTFDKNDCIPIPSISDCLEKLRELEYWYDISLTRKSHSIGIWHEKNEDKGFDAVNLHEALLSALLEVLTNE